MHSTTKQQQVIAQLTGGNRDPFAAIMAARIRAGLVPPPAVTPKRK